MSTVGLGAAISFAAYLLGSLSESLFSPVLTRLFSRTWPGSPDPAIRKRTPLSDRAVSTLAQVASMSGSQLTKSLTISSQNVDQFIDRFASDTYSLAALPEIGLPERSRSASVEAPEYSVDEALRAERRRDAVLASWSCEI